MGTEMTYEDLSNYLSEPMEDYTYQFSADTKKDESCWVIDATPRDRANSKYSKRTIWIDKVTFQQIQTHFYNKKNVLEKIFEAKDIRKIDGTDLYKAHYIKIENILTKNKTEVYYEDFVINKGIDENIFSKSYIETL